MSVVVGDRNKCDHRANEGLEVLERVRADP